MKLTTYIKTFLIALICFVLLVPSDAQASSKKITAVADWNQLIINGNYQDITMGMYKIGGKNYYKLHDIAEILNDTASRFNVIRNSAYNTYTLVTNQRYSVKKEYCSTCEDKKENPSGVKKATLKLKINGKQYKRTSYIIQNTPYVSITELASLLRIKASEDKEKSILKVSSLKSSKVVHSLGSYSKDDENNEFDNNSVKNPLFDRYPTERLDWLIKNTNNTYSLLEVGKKIKLTNFSTKNKVTSKKYITKELPLFGTFYSGEKYNYIAFGKDNDAEKNVEVIRIVKYDKNFKRLDSVSIKGDSIITTSPFSASPGGQFAEENDKLVFNTTRLRYKSEDGINHQSQLTIELNTTTMKVTNEFKAFQWNHVSHSFDQYALMDDGNPVYLDLGDAYPRAIVMQKQAAINRDLGITGAWNLFEISGNEGNNFTGVTIGGFEQTKRDYVVAYSTINQSKFFEIAKSTNLDMQKKIYAMTTNKAFTEKEQDIKRNLIMNYENTAYFNSGPTMVKINNNRFILLWNEFNKYQHFQKLRYVYVDGTGKKISKIYSTPEIQLSYSKPIVVGNKLIGFSKTELGKELYEIKLVK